MKQSILMGVMVVAAACGAIGQIMLRLASEKAMTIKSILTNGPLYYFVLTYGVAVCINIWVYRAGGKVAIIYPVIALSYIFAALLAWRYFGETISAWTWAGTACILIGVGLIGYGA